MPATREERQATISFLMPFQPRGIDPDIGIDQAERQIAAYSYPGIAAEEPPESTGGGTLDDLDNLLNIRRVLR